MACLKLASDEAVLVQSTQARWVAVRVQAPFEVAPAGSHTIHFNVVAKALDAKVSEKSVFIIPR
jgi:IG-like fold at C-terminal of FixG, putative oxidoreductase